LSIISDRVDAVNKAKVLAKDHCMCAKFHETPHHYIAYYPTGYFPEGVRVAKGMDCENALKRMLEVMERHWKESFA